MLEYLSTTPITDILGRIVLIVATIGVFIQISPIKLNPWSWVARKIGAAINHDMMDEVKALQSKVDAMQDEIEEANAKNLRTKIIRFASEIRVKHLHTRDYFDEIMDDITRYDKYCNDHPDFKNNITIASSELIIETYKKCLEENSFL